MKKAKYYSLIKNKSKEEADLTIFGDITSYPYDERDVSSYNLSKQLSELTGVKTINVHINSYGGEVAEGLAIYNSLKQHKAKVKTFCDGFACSIASVIFMAGDERIMSKSSLLMIHNAWTFAMGNANELRKQADDLDTITQASVNAYMEHVSISEKELKELLDNESWLDYSEALEKGFVTKVVESDSSDKASQSVKQHLINIVMKHNQKVENNEDKKCEGDDIDVTDDVEGGDEMKYECQECGYIHDGELPEYFVCPECGADKEQFIEVVEDDDTSDGEDVEIEEEVTGEEDDVTDTEEPKKDDEETANEKAVQFFNAIIGGMKND